MKRRILSLLLCFGMSVSLLAGCGTKDVDATNDKVTDSSSVKVTKKLEEEYVARIEAYQEYYAQLEEKYSDYVVGGTITLDKENLPLLWVCILEDENSDNVLSTQLVGYKDKQAIVLAERGEMLGPYRGDFIMATTWERETNYLFDEDKQDFIAVNDELESVNVDELVNENIFFSEDEIDYKISLYECVQSLDEIQVAVNEEEKKVVYLGKRSSPYTEVLTDFGVLYDVYGAVALNDSYADNKEIVKYFEELSDLNLDENMKDSLLRMFSEEYSIDVTENIYKGCLKEVPDSIHTLPNGAKYSVSDATGLIRLAFDKLSGEDNEWKIRSLSEDAGQYFRSIDVERIMRGLLKKPVYTQEELYLYLASVAYDCEILEIDLESYLLSDASDSFIADLIKDYMENKRVYEIFFMDELIVEKNAMSKLNVAFSPAESDEEKKHSEQSAENHEKSTIFDAEPYKTIRENDIDSCDYENNIVTITLEDSDVQYQFQIEFTEAGDKISKITYIDPMLSMNEEEKQEDVNIGNSATAETSQQESVSEVYYDMMYSCDVFELNNQRLQIIAGNFSVDSEISNDCV